MEPHAAIRSSLATPAQEYVNPELDSLVLHPLRTFFPLIFDEHHEESAIIIPLVKKETSEQSQTDRSNCQTYLNSWE